MKVTVGHAPHDGGLAEPRRKIEITGNGLTTTPYPVTTPTGETVETLDIIVPTAAEVARQRRAEEFAAQLRRAVQQEAQQGYDSSGFTVSQTGENHWAAHDQAIAELHEQFRQHAEAVHRYASGWLAFDESLQQQLGTAYSLAKDTTPLGYVNNILTAFNKGKEPGERVMAGLAAGMQVVGALSLLGELTPTSAAREFLVDEGAWLSRGNRTADDVFGNWTSRPEGTRLKRVGNYWVKEVDPSVSGVRQFWGRGSLKAQARALDKLGDLAPPHLFKNGKLIIRDVGQFEGTTAEFWDIWSRGSIRLGTPFNDIRPRNIGATGQIFDPAWHPVHRAGGWVIVGGSAAYVTAKDYIIFMNQGQR